MKRFIFTLVGLLGMLGISQAQMLDPVSWTKQVVKTGEDTYQIIITGNLDDGWATYSMTLDDDEGPVPTTVTFEDGAYTLSGDITECGGRMEAYDAVFEMDLVKFADRIVYVQEVKASVPTVIKGDVNFMVCDDMQCLPPDYYDFEIDLASANEVENFSVESACEGESFGALDAFNGEDDGFIDPVEWSIELIDKGNNEYDVVLKGKIIDGWDIYSQTIDPEAGPFPTMVSIEEMENIELIGDVVEASPYLETKMDPVFEVVLSKISKEGTYTQSFKSTGSDAKLVGFLEFQACDDTQCIPPTYVDFEVFPAKGVARIIGDEEDAKVYNLGTKGEGTPIYENFDFAGTERDCGTAANIEEAATKNKAGGNLWLWIFIAGFAGGLIALLTPCVFPMIPLTVSYFTKSKKGGLYNAIIYGLSIIIIYVTLGLLITGIFGSSALNQLSTNAWFNIAFFVLFMVFAISFFGYFEITLPASWTNSADKAADRGGLLGIFFMAFTLALVSFSCTGPIIGTLLVEAATGGGPALFGYIPIGPAVGMFGFSLALALPFALFAAFPAWLTSLPSSGSWMNSVKVTLGFIEVALAFKFLSIADLTMGWKILPYELFVAVWFLCALGLFLYFFGWLKFPLDSPIKKLSLGRVSLGVFSLFLAVYIALGFRFSEKANTFLTPPMLSGLAPPAGHSYIFPSQCPLNLNCFHDYDEGKAYAKKVNKPILIDFSGFGCVNCRKMEDQVWSKDNVYNLLKDKFVLVSLYVDDRTKLDEPYISAFSNKEISTVGMKWSDFEATHFQRNSQPYYVIADSDGKILNEPRAYTPDVKTYHDWLECGLNHFDENCDGCLSAN